MLPRSPYWYAWQQVKFFIFAFPYLFFAAVTLFHIHKALKETGRAFAGSLVVLAVLAPIFLYPIGHDYFRWWSLALVNFFLAVFIVYSVHPKFVDVLERDILRYKKLMITGTLIGLTLGGVGGLVSFSFHTSPVAMAFRALN